MHDDPQGDQCVDMLVKAYHQPIHCLEEKQ